MIHKLLKFNTNLHLKRNKTLRASVAYQQATVVGILFTVEDKQKHELIKDFIKKVEQDGKDVKVLCYLPADKQNYDFLFDFFTDKDISFWGYNTSEIAVPFVQTPFDYLFYIDTEPNPLILNLLARSKAKCRIGEFWEGGGAYLEFMLKSGGSNKSLIDGIYKYTSLLR